MDIFALPLECIQQVFLHLDTQALATCALADPRFSETIYSSHFLDEYCRKSFNCTCISAADVCNANVAMPFEFWYWAYTTMKLDETDQKNIVFQSKYLTKIATLKHMYIMWLVCGLRSSYMYSHSLMFSLYPLPFNVQEAYQLTGHPGALVNDVLSKVFLALPGIMELTCISSLHYFSMQEGGHTSLPMDIVCNDCITPSLPIDFNPIFSVELITSPSPQTKRNCAVLILINEHKWVLWIGYLTMTADGQETSVAQTCLSKYFSHWDRITEIRFHAANALHEMTQSIFNGRSSGILSNPIISYMTPDIIPLTISLAQQHHSLLCKRFESCLNKNCSTLVDSIMTKYFTGSMESKDVMIKTFDKIMCQKLLLNEYVAELLKVETVNMRKLNMQQHLASIIFKSIVERIASLYRNEIHFCIENCFCHSFICGCIGYSCIVGTTITSSDNEREKIIEKCLSDRMKESMHNPNNWPSHILSAACRIIPSLVEILQSDVHMILSNGLKYVIPTHVQGKINEYLRNAGLVLTQRPPSKPRCPPLLSQVRLWSIESLS